LKKDINSQIESAVVGTRYGRIRAHQVFRSEIFEKITYNGIALAMGGKNLIEMNQPARPVPPIFVLAIEYAANAAMIVDTMEVVVATTTLFRKKGTIPAIDVVVVPNVVEPVPRKFDNVNFEGQNTGGVVNHSDSCLKAVITSQYMGNKKIARTNSATQNLMRRTTFLRLMFITPWRVQVLCLYSKLW